MNWVQALRERGETWAEFKADVKRRVDAELTKMLSLKGDDLLIAKGAALAWRRLLDEAEAGEKEEHARAVRRARESSIYAGRRSGAH
jgi:hypothetical protein